MNRGGSRNGGIGRRENKVTVQVDRTMCAGRGVCAELFGSDFPLDEWGYPLPDQVRLSRAEAAEVIDACPSAALYRLRAR